MCLISYTQPVESQLKHSIIGMALDECEHNQNKGIDPLSVQQSASNSLASQTGNCADIRKRQLFQHEDVDDLSSSSSQMKVTDAWTLYINESNWTSSPSLWKTIRLSTKFWRFFQKFYFCFFTSKVQLVFRYIFTITIYHLSPTFWQRCDPALVEVLGFLIKELDKFRFDIAFVLELFIT